jgi:hypothetical protein
MPMLAEEGASLLSNVVEQGLFVSPLKPIVLSEAEMRTVTGGEKVAFAPKIRDVDMKVDWEKMTAGDAVRRLKAFGKLWDDGFLSSIVTPGDSSSRIILSQLKEVNGSDVPTELAEKRNPIPIGNAVLLKDKSRETIYIKAANDTWVEVEACKIAGLDTTGSLKKVKLILKEKKCTINRKG